MKTAPAHPQKKGGGGGGADVCHPCAVLCARLVDVTPFVKMGRPVWVGLAVAILLPGALAVGAGDGNLCDDGRLAQTPICDTGLAPAERAARFVALLTLQEKVSQMVNDAPAVERVGLPAYEWWNEALHGVKFDCIDGHCPTSFPAPLALAASFDMDLVEGVAQRISDEARAVHTFARTSRGGYGLNVWTPNVNLVRDPRWGRGQETPGEDPFLTSRYAVHYIRAMQGANDSSAYPKLAATVKHFAVYNEEDGREGFNAIVSKVDLQQSYLPMFEASVVEGGVGSIMCSYNSVNGTPTCASSLLLKDYLRDKWGFQGFVVSDCDAVACISEFHHYAEDHAEAAAAALKAGVDLDCGPTYLHLAHAVRRGLITEAEIDTALTRLMLARVQLGLFDPSEKQAYDRFPLGIVGSAKHRAAAKDAARQGLVLLKNRVLPLQDRKSMRILVTGPHTKTTEDLCSNYFGQLANIVSLYDGIVAGCSAQVEFRTGCGVHDYSVRDFDEAVAAAASADYTIVAVGLNQKIESEGFDRRDISLPAHQQYLLERLAGVTNKIILVVIAGSSVDLSWAKASDSVAAIVFGFYPGQETGSAIADVVFGRYNPGGRLPITIYAADYAYQVDMADMDMRAGPGRTYRFYTGAPVYPFGFGLSYTTFQYEFAGTLPAFLLTGADAKAPVCTVAVKVSNAGSVAGDDAVLAFVETSLEGCPRRQLFAFDKVHGLRPGESTIVAMQFRADAAGCVDADGNRVAPAGDYTIVVGGLTHRISIAADHDLVQTA